MILTVTGCLANGMFWEFFVFGLQSVERRGAIVAAGMAVRIGERLTYWDASSPK
jgi:hypothetical protein